MQHSQGERELVNRPGVTNKQNIIDILEHVEHKLINKCGLLALEGRGAKDDLCFLLAYMRHSSGLWGLVYQ